MTVSEEAVAYIKEYKKKLISDFADPSIYLPVQDPVTYLMAGSPGAGKTEYSKRFIEQLSVQSPNRKVVRIDADEVRDWLPQYNQNNATECQEAAGRGVAKLFDFVLEKDIDTLVDGTFTPYNVAYKNVERSLHHSRKILILYIYQDPLRAWQFTKAREIKEGRPVPKDFFIQSFFEARKNVNRIKEDFKKDIQITLVIKDWDEKGVEKTYFNVDNVDRYIKKEYNLQSLKSLLVD